MKRFQRFQLPAAVLVVCVATTISVQGQTFTSLYSFDGPDGKLARAAPIQGFDGNLYGTTVYGGAHLFGTVFKMTPVGGLKTLYSFCAQADCADGYLPYGGLVQGFDGNLYGITVNGGAHGGGTIFRISPKGMLTTLYNFCAQEKCLDGLKPAGLLQASDGNLYGTTYGGIQTDFRRCADHTAQL